MSVFNHHLSRMKIDSIVLSLKIKVRQDKGPPAPRHRTVCLLVHIHNHIYLCNCSCNFNNVQIMNNSVLNPLFPDITLYLTLPWQKEQSLSTLQRPRHYHFMLIPLPYFYLMCSGMCAQTQQPLVRQQLPNAYRLYLASVSCLVMVSSSPAPEPEAQGQAAPLPNSYPSPVAVLAAEPSTSGRSLPTIPTNFLPTTHKPVVTTTNILGTVTSTQFVTTIEPTTVVRSMATTFSTVDPIISVESRPSETPYGTIKDHSSNGTMLIVSLAVVFAVLAGMVLVAVCLLCRRRQRLKVIGKGSNSAMTSTGALDDIMAAAVVQRKDSTGGFTISGGAESNRQSLIIEPSRVMTEPHHNELLVRRSTESGRYSQSARPNSRMLSPTLAPARPNVQGTGYWGGPHAGVRSGSTDTSTVYSINECISGSLESHDGYNRAACTPPYLPYAGVNGGSSAYSSDEQLLSSRHPSRRPSLSPGLRPQSEVNQSPSPIVMSSSLANQVDVHRLERPQSMLPLGPLVIPPSITTRPRSMMSPNGVYISQSQGQGSFPYPPPPRPRYQSYNLNSPSQEPTAAYTHTAQSPVGADASTESKGPAGP